MNHRRAIVLVIVSLALVCVLLLLAGSHKPLAKLKIVRFGVEQGKSVVYFRVEADTNRWLHLTPKIQKLEESGVEELRVMGTNGFLGLASDFLAPSQMPDWFVSEAESRKEFGILAPTNSSVWKLRVVVITENPNLLRRFEEFLKLWTKRAKLGKSVPSPATEWKSAYTYGVTLESDPITNSAPPDITK
jgi:hypothetical protein